MNEAALPPAAVARTEAPCAPSDAPTAGQRFIAIGGVVALLVLLVTVAALCFVY